MNFKIFLNFLKNFWGLSLLRLFSLTKVNLKLIDLIWILSKVGWILLKVGWTLSKVGWGFVKVVWALLKVDRLSLNLNQRLNLNFVPELSFYIYFSFTHFSKTI